MKTINIIFKNFFLFPSNITMSGKNKILNDKKISKSNFYKNKKLFKIDGINGSKMLVSKRKSFSEKTHLNTLLGMMIMMTLEYYA